MLVVGGPGRLLEHRERAFGELVTAELALGQRSRVPAHPLRLVQVVAQPGHLVGEVTGVAGAT